MKQQWRMCAVIGMTALSMTVIAVPADVRVDGVAAYANAYVITYSDVLGASRELQQMAASGRREEANALYRKILDELINRKLILDAYENQKEIRIPDERVDEQVETVIREVFKDDRTAFLHALAEDGQSEQAWREQIREQMAIAAMRNLRVDARVRVSPLAVHARYESDPGAYAEPARVKFAMMVIARGTDAESRLVQQRKLDEARAALAAGTAFADVARRYSEDAMAAEGGERDWMEPDMLRPELREVVMNAPTGTVSEPMTIGPHHVLVRVLDRRDGRKTAFEDVYSRIERELEQEMTRQVYDEWMVRLRRDAYVRILNEDPF